MKLLKYLSVLLILLCLLISCKQPHVHVWVDTVISPADCINTGILETRCSECGESKTSQIPRTDHHKGEKETLTASTCTVAGEAVYKCTVCHEIIQREALPLIDHVYGEAHTTTASTCTAPGVSTRACTVCGFETTTPLALINHTWDSGTAISSPTCTESGLTELTCTVCGNKRNISTPPDENAHPATSLTWTTTIAPTYTAGGRKNRKCEDCGDILADLKEDIPRIGLSGNWSSYSVNLIFSGSIVTIQKIENGIFTTASYPFTYSANGIKIDINGNNTYSREIPISSQNVTAKTFAATIDGIASNFASVTSLHEHSWETDNTYINYTNHGKKSTCSEHDPIYKEVDFHAFGVDDICDICGGERHFRFETRKENGDLINGVEIKRTETFILPAPDEGYEWMDSVGAVYEGGQSFTPTKDLTVFTLSALPVFKSLKKK